MQFAAESYVQQGGIGLLRAFSYWLVLKKLLWLVLNSEQFYTDRRLLIGAGAYVRRGVKCQRLISSGNTLKRPYAGPLNPQLPKKRNWP
jgi:hypothetical protein